MIEFSLGAKPFYEILREILETAWAIEGSAGSFQDFKDMALQGERPVEERVKILEQAGMSDGLKDNLCKILDHLKQSRMAILMKSTR